MSGEIKTIGVLTSGGDSPGMNACARAVIRAGIAAGYTVKGIQRGYAGLLDEDITELSSRTMICALIITLEGFRITCLTCTPSIKRVE